MTVAFRPVWFKVGIWLERWITRGNPPCLDGLSGAILGVLVSLSSPSGAGALGTAAAFCFTPDWTRKRLGAATSLLQSVDHRRGHWPLRWETWNGHFFWSCWWALFPTNLDRGQADQSICLNNHAFCAVRLPGPRGQKGFADRLILTRWR